MRDQDIVNPFIGALQAGQICLHPTDTIPGLTCDPYNLDAIARLSTLKQRSPRQPLLCMVADVAGARNFWRPLPRGWEAILAAVWPAPLSVLWEASVAAPLAVCGDDGVLGLRVPSLGQGALWFLDVLQRWGKPLPTTSVNRHGEIHANDWTAAAGFATQVGDIYVPHFKNAQTLSPSSGDRSPSTIVRITSDGNYEMVRAGAFSLRDLDTVVAQFRG